jgi:hypothetical protein
VVFIHLISYVSSKGVFGAIAQVDLNCIKALITPNCDFTNVSLGCDIDGLAEVVS